ncbi:hypothetical protein V6N13_138910 [Hibiscus sabdariffa]
MSEKKQTSGGACNGKTKVHWQLPQNKCYRKSEFAFPAHFFAAFKSSFIFSRLHCSSPCKSNGNYSLLCIPSPYSRERPDNATHMLSFIIHLPSIKVPNHLLYYYFLISYTTCSKPSKAWHDGMGRSSALDNNHYPPTSPPYLHGFSGRL